jgi:cobalamin biosynthesis protein CbiG
MIAVCFITGSGEKTAGELAASLPESEVVDLRGKGRLRLWVKDNFHLYQGHVFIMSLGIVYRMIDGLITDKYHDPAVIVVDDARRYAIAALSGHEGGANRLCWQVAGILGCEPVVTTASDTNKRFTLGAGCRKGVSVQEVEDAVQAALDENHLKPDDIRLAGSIDIKRAEKGLRDAFGNMDIPLVFLDSRRIGDFCGSDSVSPAAQRQLGVPGVSEPCALLLGRNSRLVMPRKIFGRVTLALAEEDL